MPRGDEQHTLRLELGGGSEEGRRRRSCSSSIGGGNGASFERLLGLEVGYPRRGLPWASLRLRGLP